MFKLIAIRDCYVPQHRKQYAAGEAFSLWSEIDAEQFIRRGKAKFVFENDKPADAENG